jgi:hypothetical protein
MATTRHRAASAAARMATLDRYNEMDDTLGRPVQPGSKPVLRLLRCDYHLRNPAERYLIRFLLSISLIRYSTSLYEDTGERWVFKNRLKQDPHFAHLVPFPRRSPFDLAARYSSVANDR